MAANVRSGSRSTDPGAEEREDFVPCFKQEVVERLKGKMPSEEAIEETRVLFNALADCARLKILCAFGDGEELWIFGQEYMSCWHANMLGRRGLEELGRY